MPIRAHEIGTPVQVMAQKFSLFFFCLFVFRNIQDIDKAPFQADFFFLTVWFTITTKESKVE